MRILVIDDNTSVGLLWERMLAEDGYQVRRAVNARSALMEGNRRVGVAALVARRK